MTFAPLRNDSFLRACRRLATPHTPVWLMRQAGRYLPEYRATRTKAGSFMGLATNTDFATEVTLQPLERYKLDRKSTRLNSSHGYISYAVFCLKKKKKNKN